MGLLCRVGEVTVVSRLGAPHEVCLTLSFVLRMVVAVLGHRGRGGGGGGETGGGGTVNPRSGHPTTAWPC
jgi:hypothetical protein